MTSARLSPQMLMVNFTLLTATERAVLQFLSILLTSINRSNLVRMLRNSEVFDSKGKPLSPIDLTLILDRLFTLNLVIVESEATHQVRCAPAIAFHATRSAVADGHFRAMAMYVQNNFPLFLYPSSAKIASFDRILQALRIAIFAGSPDHVHICLEGGRKEYLEEMTLRRPFALVCATPFDSEWFRILPPAIQADALEEIVPHILEQFESVAELLPLLQELRHHPNEALAPRFRKALVTVLIFQGELAQAQAILDAPEPVKEALALQGWICFLRGETEKAILAYEANLKQTRKAFDKRMLILNNLEGSFFLLALLKSGTPAHRARLAELLKYTNTKPMTPFVPICRSLEALLLALENKTVSALAHLEGGGVFQGMLMGIFTQQETVVTSRFTALFKIIIRQWIDLEHARKHKHGLGTSIDLAKRHGHQWAAMEASALSAVLEPDKASNADYAATIQSQTGMHSILPIIAQEEKWERALNALIHLGTQNVGKLVEAKTGENSRLVWMIRLSGKSVNSIQPREQTRSATGVWSKGRPVALKRLVQPDKTLNFLTEQDRRIGATVVRTNDYGGAYYELDWAKAMLAMVGHPLVFWEETPHINVEVVKTEPELLVEPVKGQVTIRFATPVDHEGVIALRETPTRCTLVEITKAHTRIAEILGEKGLQVPSKAKEQVMQAMQAVAPLVTVHSGIGGSMANIEELSAEAKPHIHLLPHGDGLKLNLLVRPFSGDGPYFQPGKGGKTIIAEVNGKRVQTHRNLQEESGRASRVVASCATLAAEEGQTEWVVDEPDAALELLLELHCLEDQAVIAWPDGEKLRVTRPVAMDALRVRIQRDQDWFAVTGTVALEGDLLLEMSQLLELARGKESRFIPLGEGKFLALTEAFRKRLAELDAFSHKSAKGQRFHPLATPVLRELLAEAGAVETDRPWKSHLKQLDQAQSVDPPLPSTLRAELREYQVAGFRWLTRLAAWGVGGCLADDMGLGKTLQALALLLHRAQEGPSLVVAPTSVGLNWITELERFAPTLNGIVFGSGQRQQTLDGLQPFDVVICSYGLLQSESEMLSSLSWNVIVLDEAQAIKNRLTKRSQSAMALKGAFRLITTGTPVENHLGELWNLFQFINPGLLGSLERFNERFAAPIERNGDKAAQKRLRKLIQPFLLRRTKSQVLEELPPRTEIVLTVELSPEETAFYETLRRQALEQIENLDGPMEQKRFQILAEIMRLRRACCNSRLVVPDSHIESSKLALFWEVVEELLENRHKALVFSQFVDHLALIRALLDEKKVSYQYLDGSTPAKERQRRVEAFQSGQGDLFLISLRAGGVGINLTAADYVIHMDPWWNPAVEDQASDRAHRIGQLRPVTIYRLVTKETIEAKIVELHRHKRDLADGLLEGGDLSGKLSLDVLLNMIRGQE